MLTDGEIFLKTSEGVSAEVSFARKMSKKVILHLTGEGAEDFLFRLDDYENSAQQALRKKLLKSNKAVLGYLLRPLDKIFTAKGGSVSFNTSSTMNEKMKDAVINTLGTNDIKKHLKKKIRDKFIIDPNSILFFDIDSDGQPVETVINSDEQVVNSIINNRIEWFIYTFGSHVRKHVGKDGKETEEKVPVYRYISKEKDIMYILLANSIQRVGEDIDRKGRMPGTFLGDEIHATNNVFKSIIWDIIEELDEMLRDVSIQTVHKLAHNYPIYWWYSNDCIRCKGEGEIIVENAGMPERTTCPSCGGDGNHKRKNASDAIVLKVPTNDDPVLAPNIAGVIQPSTEWIKSMSDFEDRAIMKMYKSLWGDVKQSSGKRETATGRIIDAQPSVDRLRDHSLTFAKLHKFYMDEIAEISTRKRVNSSVFYGTRYLLETSDEIVSKLNEAKRDGAPSSVIIDLVSRYYDSEYQNDDVELIKRKKIASLEPFPDISASDVIKSNNPVFINKKLMYSQFIKSLKDEDLILKSLEELEIMFNKFIENVKTT